MYLALVRYGPDTFDYWYAFTHHFDLRISDVHQERSQSLGAEEDIETVEGANTFLVPVDCIDFKCVRYFQPCF